MTAQEHLPEAEAKSASPDAVAIELPKDEISKKFMQLFANALAEKFSEGVTDELAKVRENENAKARVAAKTETAEEEKKEEEKEEEKTEEEDKEPEPIKAEDMVGELKKLDSIWVKDSDGNYSREFVDWDVNRKVHDDDEFIPDEHGTWVLVLRRVFEMDNHRVRKLKLDVKSPLIRKILKDVAKEAAMESEKASIPWPNDNCFTYREEIKAAAEKEGPLAVSHVAVLLKLIQESYAGRLRDVRNLIPKGAVTYELLAEVFRPGVVVTRKITKFDRAYRITNVEYTKDDWNKIYEFEVTGEWVDWDGEKFGTESGELQKFTKFEGVRYLKDMDLVPLEFLPDCESLKQRFLERSRKFVELSAGLQFKHYTGPAYFMAGRCPQQIMINSRVMIDARTYNAQQRSYSIESDGVEEQLTPDGKLTDELLLICTNVVPAFSFTQKRFYTLKVDNVTDIVFNDEVFDKLVLPAAQKELVQVLVKNQNKEGGFDDFIEGKGKGLVSVLHGPPGVGKTMTAEAVAEYSRRPLYTVTSGELGTGPESLEEQLGKVLELAKTFNAVLLIDEADVFLEQRSTGDLLRNAMVSIFLRLLEYYQGILFLTTNRVGTFDEAFHSRIHISLCYQNLTPDSREKVWRNFGNSMAKEDVALTDTDYKVLAQTPLNGRQIKNLFRTSQALAMDKGVPISMEHMNTVLEVMTSFDLARTSRGTGVEK